MKKFYSLLPFIFCSRLAGSLPNPERATGTENTDIPIRHIVVLMQENHSFDQYFGKLNDPAFYGSEIDGLHLDRSNLNLMGEVIHPYAETRLCVQDPIHDWDSAHQAWNNGALDGFVSTNDQQGSGKRIMGYYSSLDLPYYYARINSPWLIDIFHRS